MEGLFLAAGSELAQAGQAQLFFQQAEKLLLLGEEGFAFLEPCLTLLEEGLVFLEPCLTLLKEGLVFLEPYLTLLKEGLVFGNDTVFFCDDSQQIGRRK